MASDRRKKSSKGHINTALLIEADRKGQRGMKGRGSSESHTITSMLFMHILSHVRLHWRLQNQMIQHSLEKLFVARVHLSSPVQLVLEMYMWDFSLILLRFHLLCLQAVEDGPESWFFITLCGHHYKPGATWKCDNYSFYVFTEMLYGLPFLIYYHL